MLQSKLLWTIILVFTVFGAGCRYDMQDQPRYKAFKESDFFADKRASRNLPDGTVPRGQLRADKALYTGKKDIIDPNAVVQTVKDEAGNALIASFPNDIDEFPVPVTEELVNRGEQRYRVFCIVCHGPVGDGNGMLVRRGFSKPPTYNDDRLRNAPVGHFFDVITNGQGKMNGYASQIPVPDRWAIVAYIRALQISQKTDSTNSSTMTSNTNTAPKTAESPKPATNGGVK